MPIYRTTDGAFVVSDALIEDAASTCEKRKDEEYPRNEPALHPTKLQKVTYSSNDSQPRSINEAARAKNVYRRAYSAALATLSSADARALGSAVRKLRREGISKTEVGKHTLYDLLEGDLLTDAEVSEKNDQKQGDDDGKLRWMLMYVVREPNLTVREKAELCVLMGEVGVDWERIERRLNRAFGDE